MHMCNTDFRIYRLFDTDWFSVCALLLLVTKLKKEKKKDVFKEVNMF